ncbi:MAG TPA: hypothetical protein VGG64_30265 [Pirellulales bacterium]|jgi:hypothetical protein
MKGIACALGIGAVVGYAATVGSATDETKGAGRAPAGRPSTVSIADAPAPARDIPTDPHELAVAYAEMSLKVVQLDYQKMTDLQSRVRGSISNSQLDRVEGLVRAAEDNLRLAKAGNTSRGAMNVVRAREAVRTAEQVWKTAQQVKVAANAISDIELSRLRMLVELEKLSLARAEAAAATDSPLDDLAWENDQLRDEMSRLRYRFEALTARR